MKLLNNGNQTWVMYKPDGIILSEAREDFQDRVIKSGLKIERDFLVRFDEKTLREHYKHHVNKPFFKDILDYMLWEEKAKKAFYEEIRGRNPNMTTLEPYLGISIGMIISGDDALKQVRNILGPTRVEEAREKAPYSIRGLYGILNENIESNIAHGTDKPEEFLPEVKRFVPFYQ